mgnify:FL=1
MKPRNMNLVTYNNFAKAKAADAATLAFLIARDGAHGSAWSNFYSDPTEKDFGVTYSDDTDVVLKDTPWKEKKSDKTDWHKYEEPVVIP